MRRAHRAFTTGSACRTVGRHPGAFADVQAFVAAQSRRRPRTVRGWDRDDAPAPLTVGQQAAQEAPELVDVARSTVPAARSGSMRSMNSSSAQWTLPKAGITVWSSRT